MPEIQSAQDQLAEVAGFPQNYWKWIRCGIPFIQAVLRAYEQYRKDGDKPKLAEAVVEAVKALLDCLKK
jgi:hypothetical protein